MPLHARQTLLAISFVPSLVVCHREQLIEADEVLRCSKRQFGLLDLT
jgi:hypothetical protein